MAREITLSEHVRKRNGVPLGAKGSMKNMLERSFGAGSFHLFWRYWNPIWGYYLSRNVMKPLRQYFSAGVATILTFAVSGAAHDLAVAIIKWDAILFFTPWFAFMGIIVVVTNKFGISYARYNWLTRMIVNFAFVSGSLGLMILFRSLFV